MVINNLILVASKTAQKPECKSYQAIILTVTKHQRRHPRRSAAFEACQLAISEINLIRTRRISSSE